MAKMKSKEARESYLQKLKEQIKKNEYEYGKRLYEKGYTKSSNILKVAGSVAVSQILVGGVGGALAPTEVGRYVIGIIGGAMSAASILAGVKVASLHGRYVKSLDNNKNNKNNKNKK